MNSKQFVSETVSAGSTSRRGFVETLVPFYAGCLIEVGIDSIWVGIFTYSHTLAWHWGNTELGIRKVEYVPAQACLLGLSA
jgi:hypothetical protein